MRAIAALVLSLSGCAHGMTRGQDGQASLAVEMDDRGDVHGGALATALGNDVLQGRVEGALRWLGGSDDSRHGAMAFEAGALFQPLHALTAMHSPPVEVQLEAGVLFGVWTGNVSRISAVDGFGGFFAGGGLVVAPTSGDWSPALRLDVRRMVQGGIETAIDDATVVTIGVGFVMRNDETL